MFRDFDPESNLPIDPNDPSTWNLHADGTVDIGGTSTRRVSYDVALANRRRKYQELLLKANSSTGYAHGPQNMISSNTAALMDTMHDPIRRSGYAYGYDSKMFPTRDKVSSLFDAVLGNYYKDIYEGMDPFDAAVKHAQNLPYSEPVKQGVIDIINYDRNPVLDEKNDYVGRPNTPVIPEEEFNKLVEVEQLKKNPNFNVPESAVNEPKVVATENVSPKIDSTPIKKEMYHGAAPGSNLTAGTIDPLARSSGRTPLPAFTLGDVGVAESYAKTGGVGMKRTAEGPLYKVGLEFDSEKRIVGAYDAAPDDFIEFMRNSLPEEGVPNYVDEVMAEIQGGKTVRFRDIFDEKLMDLAPDERSIYGVMNALSDVHEFYRPLENYDYKPRAQGSIEAKRYGIDALTWDDYGDEVLGLLDPDDLRSGTGRKNISYIEEMSYPSVTPSKEVIEDTLLSDDVPQKTVKAELTSVVSNILEPPKPKRSPVLKTAGPEGAQAWIGSPPDQPGPKRSSTLNVGRPISESDKPTPKPKKPKNKAPKINTNIPDDILYDDDIPYSATKFNDAMERMNYVKFWENALDEQDEAKRQAQRDRLEERDRLKAEKKRTRIEQRNQPEQQKPNRKPTLKVGEPVKGPNQTASNVVNSGTGTPQRAVPQAAVISQSPPPPPPVITNVPNAVGGGGAIRSTAANIGSANASSRAVVQGVSGAKNLRVLGAAAVAGLLIGGHAMFGRTQQDNIDRRLEMQRRGIIS